jgi:hypothetical protein
MLSLFFFVLNIATADLCKNWGSAEHFGNVPQTADEASGIIVSRLYSDRIYHINDGQDGRLIISNSSGNKVKTAKIEGVNFLDVEELAYGRCPDNQGACIYVGDIGDNGRARASIKVIIIREIDFEKSITPFAVWELKYPDHPHNAEAMALHPGGSLIVITKEKAKGKAGSAKIFKASLRQRQNTFTRVGEIDLPALSKKNDTDDHVVTGMTISDDGKKFILMTYRRAWEFNLDLSGSIAASKDLRLGVDYQPIAIGQLQQQEAITFLPDQKSFIYSTESGNNYFDNSSVKAVRCLD